MAHLITLIAPAARESFWRRDGVGTRGEVSAREIPDEGVVWFVLSALPLTAAWLVAEFWFTSPSFSGNVFAFAATWAAFELLMRGVIALATKFSARGRSHE
jgi:hypothetical protein